ncbi:MAG TPA: FlgD immunoglobulin-like domain containing protein, partial [Dongiaceae bacterium]|nr:FlgD immunoglobulin-like domain containing protein [Dongiaceae bacterium]
RHAGVATVYVECSVPASGAATVTVTPHDTSGVGGSPPRPFALEAPSPNPFVPGQGELYIGFTLPAPGTVTVTVYDLGGRSIAVPYSGATPAGVQGVLWNGLTAEGARVDPGLYVIRLHTASGVSERKVTVLR